MKLKYYLRGLGIGIIVTTLILMIAGTGQKEELTDAQIIERAKELGMVMEDSGSTLSDEMDSESEQADESETTLESKENEPSVDDGQTPDGEQTVAPDEAASVGQEGQTPEDNATPEQTDNAGQEPYMLAVNAGEVCRQVCDELQEKGIACNFDEIEKDIIERDRRDMTREESPLRKAEDAIEVDTSDMSIEQVIATIIRICEEKKEK